MPTRANQPTTQSTLSYSGRDNEHDARVGDVEPLSIVPSAVRSLRACLGCKMIKTTDQFVKYGCENCARLQMQGDRGRVEECTTTSFEGMAIMTDPAPEGEKQSWVARWQGIDQYARGAYAIHVRGELPEDFQGGGDYEEDMY